MVLGDDAKVRVVKRLFHGTQEMSDIHPIDDASVMSGSCQC